MKAKLWAFMTFVMMVMMQPMSVLAMDLQGPTHSLRDPITASDFSGFLGKYKVLCVAISGICTITSLIMFVISITKLSTSAGNDMRRGEAIKGILYSGLCLALFGGITTVVGIFWTVL